ncbi:MAG TPA: RDD family protein [Dehalococcoidia bacterium]|nr:RDD family protein [Dehalococcoidia bacterium]
MGKFISTVVLCIGFFWVAGDRQKQGWHDKIANTYVVKVETRR